jgi:hypothetical protein
MLAIAPARFSVLGSGKASRLSATLVILRQGRGMADRPTAAIRLQCARFGHLHRPRLRYGLDKQPSLY